ncbi:HAD family phosphatase [Niveibacterium sp. 24ML]|uniref:HAD family hydrolase n=1 Tax=Niveibacterium sp. 24ML TaxID=2985512 RepID=UPI0022719A69|nr:HAD family phosphatase [Niveibacterium sp. 24ML]MCX9155304.1 HAD family phosphatase [Niveibacterium sp. 24ML]
MRFSFKAVLFDMDGTITDSTPFHDLAWDQFAKAHLGAGITPGDPRLVAGRTADVICALLGREVAGEAAQRLHDDKEQRFQAIAHGKLKPINGLGHYLALLAERGIPAALVTNAPRINIDFTLAQLRLENAFEVLLGAEDVLRGKPHPDPFLEACRRLGVAPEAALVHEDSGLGIRAGVAAGAPVAALLTGLSATAARQAGARWVARDYDDWCTQIAAAIA